MRPFFVWLAISLFGWCLLYGYRTPGSLTPDTFHFAGVAKTLASEGRLATYAIRNLNASAVFPQPLGATTSLLPTLLAILLRITGLEALDALVVLNAAFLLLTAAAVVWISRTLLPKNWFWLALAYPLFLFRDGGYTTDAVALGSVVLAILLQLILCACVLKGLQSRSFPLSRCVHLGLTLSALAVCRGEQILVVAVFFPLHFFFYRQLVGSAVALRCAGTIFAIFIAAYSPWAALNYHNFGSPYVHSGMSAVMTGTNAVTNGIDFSDASQVTPPTYVLEWIYRKSASLRVTFAEVFNKMAYLLWIVPIAGFFYSRVTLPARFFLMFSMITSLLVVWAAGMTGWISARYYSSTHLYLWMSLLLIGHTALAKRARWFFPVGCTTALVVALLLGGAVRFRRQGVEIHQAFFGHFAKARVAAAFSKDQTLQAHRAIAPFLTKRPILAVEDADGFTFFTGIPSLYLAQNIWSSGPPFDAFLRKWRPDFILTNDYRTERLGLNPYVVARPLQDYSLSCLTPLYESGNFL